MGHEQTQRTTPAQAQHRAGQESLRIRGQDRVRRRSAGDDRLVSKGALENEEADVKRALITGITGQDGSYLAELLLDKNYEVHGIIRRSSSFNTGRIDHLYQDPHAPGTRLKLHYGDLNDASSLNTLLRQTEPDEIYNLGAQSHVRV